MISRTRIAFGAIYPFTMPSAERNREEADKLVQYLALKNIEADVRSLPEVNQRRQQLPGLQGFWHRLVEKFRPSQMPDKELLDIEKLPSTWRNLVSKFRPEYIPTESLCVLTGEHLTGKKPSEAELTREKEIYENYVDRLLLLAVTEAIRKKTTPASAGQKDTSNL